MTNDTAQKKILGLLDVIAVEVAAVRADALEHRSETAELRIEVRTGFGRLERRLGHVETRVENLETGVKYLESSVREFRSEFERRVSPLEQ